jgi:hypothetical protein
VNIILDFVDHHPAVQTSITIERVNSEDDLSDKTKAPKTQRHLITFYNDLLKAFQFHKDQDPQGKQSVSHLVSWMSPG